MRESLRTTVLRGGFYCGKKGDAQKVSFALLGFVKNISSVDNFSGPNINTKLTF